jgi:hypothetical protein
MKVQKSTFSIGDSLIQRVVTPDQQPNPLIKIRETSFYSRNLSARNFSTTLIQSLYSDLFVVGSKFMYASSMRSKGVVFNLEDSNL